MTPPAARPAAEAGYGLCPTRGTDDPRRRPWHYGHAAGIEGLHWDIYAGEGADGWLVASVGTEADAALIVSNVNAAAESDASALRTALMEECRDCRTPEQSATLTGYVCPRHWPVIKGQEMPTLAEFAALAQPVSAVPDSEERA